MLADIFENFIYNCLKTYHLDPANFVSGPSLSYHALLLISNVVIEPVPNMEIYYFIERAKHGGLSQVSTRYSRSVNSKSKALRKYFSDPEFDENALTASLYYIECNQLYPTAMLHALPIGRYEFVTLKGKDVDWLAGLGKDDEYRYLIEQTGYHTKETHDRNNDFPPLPEDMKRETVSPFNAERYDGEVPSVKLIAHIDWHHHNVNRYIELQEAKNQGYIIT
jgi:hypothetical protein